MSNILEYIRNYDKNEYIHYDEINKYGIKLMNNDTDLTTINLEDDIDVVIINSTNFYDVEFGNYIVCEVSENLYDLFENLNENIYVFNENYGWFYISYPHTLHVEIDKCIKHVFKCSRIKEYDYDIFDIIKEDKIYEDNINKILILNGRCINSMNILDKIHREYLLKYKFKKNDNVAIKAVAGSGKTTTLLNLSIKYKTDKILYLAFNKDLIKEIKNKKYNRNIKNINAITFDSLLREIFIDKSPIKKYHIIYLKPSNIASYFEIFNEVPWCYMSTKKSIIKKISDFCSQVEYSDINDYIKNTSFFNTRKPKWIKIYINIWENLKNYKYVTFDSIRKLVQINNWADGYIDTHYDKIFVDEAQDFDMVMLSMLLNNTSIPKLYVGDPLQAIYEWRGSINTFENLPRDSLIVEFYSTYRIGEPACSEIRDIFEDCWMITNNENETHIKYETIPDNKYTYLFRSWKGLLLTAKTTKDIYINNYNTKISEIKKLHEILIKNPDKKNIMEFQNDDELPMFLIKLSSDELSELLNNIESNLVDAKDAYCTMSTIHTYKGLESNIIRIYDDIKVHSEENIYYVALTRGIKEIILDKKYDKLKSSIKINTNITDNTDYILLVIGGKTSEEIAELNNISENDLLLKEEYNNIPFNLLDELKIYRTNKATELKYPPFIIFSNRVFKEFLINKPQNKKDILIIKGFGEKMYSNYGEDIINIIKNN